LNPEFHCTKWIPLVFVYFTIYLTTQLLGLLFIAIYLLSEYSCYRQERINPDLRQNIENNLGDHKNRKERKKERKKEREKEIKKEKREKERKRERERKKEGRKERKKEKRKKRNLVVQMHKYIIYAQCKLFISSSSVWRYSLVWTLASSTILL
jgi:hypothetical protein